MNEAWSYIPLVMALSLLVGMTAWWALSGLRARRDQRRHREWAVSQGLREVSEGMEVPAMLRGSSVPVRVSGGFVGGRGFVLQLSTTTTPASRNPDAPFGWLVMGVWSGRRIEGKVIGLRPVVARVSWLDLYSLGHGSDLVLLSFPSVDSPEGFVVFGEEGSDVGPAVELVRSGEVPEDLGVMLRDGWVVVDLTIRAHSAERIAQAWETAMRIAGSDLAGSRGGGVAASGEGVNDARPKSA